MLAIAHAPGNPSVIVQSYQMPAFIVRGGAVTVIRVKFPVGHSPIVKVDATAHSLHIRQYCRVALRVNNDVSESRRNPGTSRGEEDKLLMG
jgi:hypothetical protein